MRWLLAVAVLAPLACRGAPASLRLRQARAIHSATVLRDGSVLLAGGFVRNGVLLDSTELFDPKSRAFADGPKLPGPRLGHSATLLPSGKVLMAWVLDP